MTSVRPTHPFAVLGTLDPRDPRLDDLDPLRAVVEGAQVVAVGEGAHFVHEFALARARLIRYLADRHGFDVLALEMGTAEAAAVGPWLAGDGDEGDLPGLLPQHSLNLFGELLRHLRHLRAGGARPFRIVGIDLPNTLTLLPDLDPVAAYLREVDPATAGLMTGLLRTAAEITGGSAAASAPQWASLEPDRQEAMTAGLARLALRMDALEPLHAGSGGQDRFDTARLHLEAARHTDYMLRAMSNLFAGTGMADDTSIRDRYMATCLRWHLARTAPDARVVVVAHNNHIQKTPVTYEGYPTALPMGYHLARDLGPRYRAVGLTHTAGEIPEMSWPAPEGSTLGFTVEPVPLDPPAPGSVEGALAEAGLASDITLTDLRSPSPVVASLERMRSQGATMDLPVARSFDAILTVPTATLDPSTTF